MQYFHVTEVLKPYLDFTNVDPNQLDFASQRGTKVHELCAAYAQKIWIPSIPEYVTGYFQSFKNWFDAQVKRVFLVEEELKDHIFGIIGTPDLIVEMRTEGIVLLDNKTPIRFFRVWKGQIAAYLYLARTYTELGNSIKKGGSLQLDPKGGIAKLTWCPDEKADFAAFLSALNAMRYFKERN